MTTEEPTTDYSNELISLPITHIAIITLLPLFAFGCRVHSPSFHLRRSTCAYVYRVSVLSPIRALLGSSGLSPNYMNSLDDIAHVTWHMNEWPQLIGDNLISAYSLIESNFKRLSCSTLSG